MFPPPSLPPAGWYPDPERPGAMRWWGGREWGPSGAEGWGSRDPTELPPPGEVVGGALRRMAERWLALTLLAVLTLTPAAVLSALALHRATEGLRVIDNEVFGWTRDRVGPVAALGVPSVVLYLVGSLASAWLMLSTIDGAPLARRRFGDELSAAGAALLAALRALPRAVGWFLLVAVAAAAAGALLGVLAVAAAPIAVLASLALVPFAVWLAVKLAFVVNAVVDRPGNPLARSWRVAEGRFWPVLGRLLLLMLVVGGLAWAANLLVSLVGGGSTRARLEIADDGTIERFDLGELFPASAAQIALSVVASIVVGVVSTGTANAGTATLYRTRNPR